MAEPERNPVEPDSNLTFLRNIYGAIGVTVAIWLVLTIVQIGTAYVLVSRTAAQNGGSFTSNQVLEVSGAIGDTFGMTNSLFAGLAFAFVIITVFLQRRELLLTRDELEKSAVALGAQVALTAHASNISALNSVCQYYEMLVDKMDINSSMQALNKHLFRGKAFGYARMLEELVAYGFSGDPKNPWKPSETWPGQMIAWTAQRSQQRQKNRQLLLWIAEQITVAQCYLDRPSELYRKIDTIVNEVRTQLRIYPDAIPPREIDHIIRLVQEAVPESATVPPSVYFTASGQGAGAAVVISPGEAPPVGDDESVATVQFDPVQIAEEPGKS